MCLVEFFRFLLVGGLAAACNFLARVVFDWWLPYEAAIVLAYLVGMVVAYLLMRSIVFGATSGDPRKQVLYFCLVNALAVLQVLAVSLAMLHWVLPALRVECFAPEISHFVGLLVPAFTSYVGHKLLTFRPH